jgi:predicted  nucleic acid-binding Zn-ribbon protein
MAANRELQALIHLQSVDDRIASAKKGLAAVPGKIDAERTSLKEYETAVADCKEELEATNKRQREAELEVQAVEQKLRDTRAKQSLVKTNEEYRALNQEIRTFEEEIGALEDKILTGMENVDPAKARLATAEKSLAEAWARGRTTISRHEGEQMRLEEELASFIAKRGRSTKEVGSDWLASYEKLRKGRAGLAVCPIVEQACNGCRMSETLQRFIEIRDTGEIFTCSSCARIVYFMEPAAVGSSSAVADEPS